MNKPGNALRPAVDRYNGASESTGEACHVLSAAHGFKTLGAASSDSTIADPTIVDQDKKPRSSEGAIPCPGPDRPMPDI